VRRRERDIATGAVHYPEDWSLRKRGVEVRNPTGGSSSTSLHRVSDSLVPVPFHCLHIVVDWHDSFLM
jgi:hypothetical protein